MTITPTEAQHQYDALTQRIAALDVDIGRTIDSEQKLVLRDRRDELVKERDEVMAALVIDTHRGDLEMLQRKVSELAFVLASDHPMEAHIIINECVEALGKMDARMRGVETRITALEREKHPPRVVTFWRIAAVLVVLFGVLFGVGYQTVLFGLYPIVGVVIEGSLLLLAVFCLLLANAKLRETPQ